VALLSGTLIANLNHLEAFALGFLGMPRRFHADPAQLQGIGHDTMPPDTILLSQMMRELSAQPGFTEAFLKGIQSGTGKHGAALLTPSLIDHLRDLILGKDWRGLDHFPGWTMAEITPSVDAITHVAGKPADESTNAFIDLGNYDHAVNFNEPSHEQGFDEKALVTTIGDGVTRGDGPNPKLAPLHPESARLANVLNRLSLTEGIAGVPFTAILQGSGFPSPEALIAALINTHHTVTVTDTRYFANFGHLHYKGQDVMMPFYINSQIIIPGTKRPLLVPVAHAEYEWHIRGPLLNADVSFYFGIDGKAEFRTMDQLDQAWVMKRDAHTYTGPDAVEVTRLTAAMIRAYMRLHQAHPELPFGGYYTLGVCQDVVAAIELKLTGKATLFPNTAEDRYFTNAADAEVNSLIRRLPKDRSGHPPQPGRVFASLPVGSSPAELATVTIPGLAPDLIAVHEAWTNGTIERSRPRWQLITLAVLALAGAVFTFTRLHKRRS
jgi:hypothetical protein